MSAADPGNSPESTKEDALKVAFVEMLFALVVADLAAHVSDLVDVGPGWGNDRWPALAHLVLGLMLVATSWVGWRQSKSPGVKEQVRNIVSWQFVGLLLDVLIVILYYLLIRSVEVEQVNGKPALGAASARPEAMWMCAVFGVYAIWDLVADIFSPGCLPDGSWGLKCVMAGRALGVSVFASVLSFVLAYFVFRLAADGAPWHQVVAMDAALVCVVVLFRNAKLLENWLAPMAGVDTLKAFKPRPWGKRDVWAGAIFSIGYVVALMVGMGVFG